VGGITEISTGVVLGILQLVIGLVISMASIYLGLKTFDKITKRTDEMKELKKGNVAVGILLGAVILSIANVVQSGIWSLTGSITPGMTTVALLLAFGIGIVNLVIGVVVAIIAIYLAIIILDKITKEIDEWKEINNGNVAVAILMASVLFSVSFVVQAGVAGIAKTLDAKAIAALFGF